MFSIDGILEPRIIEDDPYASLRPLTVIERFKAVVEKHGDRPAMALKRPVNKVVPSEWKFWTWRDYYKECENFAKTLIHLKCAAFSVVNAIGFNSPEWLIANNGAQLASCIAAGIYTTNLPDACMYISEHSKAEVVVCEGNGQLAKYAEIATRLPHLKAIVVWGESPDAKLAAKFSDEQLEDRQSLVGPGNCSTLIYTSGTTGPPKAVMVSHDNVTWTTSMMTESYLDINQHDRIVSYLPLSHIAAQIIDIHVPMLRGCCTYFCQPDALKGTLTVTMKDRAQYGAAGGSPMCYGCANAIVLSKIKDALGLSECRACFVGAAPISMETLWYFSSLDIPIYEVFGQSECSGPHTICDPEHWKVGTCGRPMVGTESKIETDGELCYRGRHIFMGYMYMEEQTKATIDSDGFLHSGDVAEFDDDNDKRVMTGPSGFMKITGRKKELIITAGGENIPPVLIETEMKNCMLAVSNVMVIGDQRKYLTMLVSLKTNVDPATGKRIGSTAKTVGEAMADPLWQKYLDDGRKKGNGATTSNAQTIQKLRVLPRDFSLGEGTLTPTMKLKRSVAAKLYANLIEEMYS
eukprot:GSChrysophyteH1.ASY1.ANO1.3305.1 assembled CDS